MDISNCNLQSEIIKYLNSIDKICSKKDFGQKDYNSLYKKIIETLTWMDNNHNSVEKNIILQLLEFLLYFHNVNL